MKITMESTARIVTIQARMFSDGIQCRVWEGVTERGIKVQCLVARIAVLSTDDTSQFEAELQEARPPSADVDAFPMRMIL
jgi:hypothetical protein